MPVTAQVRGLGGHRHDMTDAGVNVVGTAAADVALASLVGLHAAGLRKPGPLRHLASGSAPQCPHQQRQCDRGGRRHEHVIDPRGAVLAIRVVAHACSIARETDRAEPQRTRAGDKWLRHTGRQLSPHARCATPRTRARKLLGVREHAVYGPAVPQHLGPFVERDFGDACCGTSIVAPSGLPQ